MNILKLIRKHEEKQQQAELKKLKARATSEPLAEAVAGYGTSPVDDRANPGVPSWMTPPMEPVLEDPINLGVPSWQPSYSEPVLEETPPWHPNYSAPVLEDAPVWNPPYSEPALEETPAWHPTYSETVTQEETQGWRAHMPEPSTAPVIDDENAAKSAWMPALTNDQGEKVFVSRESWQDSVLPHNLKLNWDDADGLYPHIMSAVNDGMVDQFIIDASVRLQEIDKNPERAVVTRAIVLFSIGDYVQAEEILKEYLTRYGESAMVLVNLAKAYDFQGKKSLRQSTLQRSLTLDPNIDNAVNWFLAIEREERGEHAYMESLTFMAANEDAWYPQFCLATEFVRMQDMDRAIPMLRKVIKKAKDEPYVLMWISGMLGQHQLSKEAIKLILPYYNPHQHEVMVGYNLLQACVDTQNKQIGEAVLQNLRDTHLPWLDQSILDDFAVKFSQII